MGFMRLTVLAAALVAAGCAVTPLQDAADATTKRLETRAGAQPAWPPKEGATDEAPEIAEALTLAGALAIAFERTGVSDSDAPRIVVSDPNGGGQVELEHPRLMAGPAVWSPDGSRLLGVANDADGDGSGGLVVIDHRNGTADLPGPGRCHPRLHGRERTRLL